MSIDEGTYYSERVSTEMNAVNRYLARASGLEAGDERDKLLEDAIEHLEKAVKILSEVKRSTNRNVREVRAGRPKKKEEATDFNAPVLD